MRKLRREDELTAEGLGRNVTLPGREAMEGPAPILAEAGTQPAGSANAEVN